MILVTGGTGLVGSYLLVQLTQENQKVRAIYRTEESLARVQKIFNYFDATIGSGYSKIEWVKADILNIPALSEAFTNITKVYHCAALISFQPNALDALCKTNIEGTANVVNLCISNAVKKLAYVSSIATLGTTENKTTLITEETQWDVAANNSDYAISKQGAEMEVWRGMQEGVSSVIINPGIILGAGFWDSGSGLLFKNAARNFPFYTSGSCGFIAVEDVVSSLIQVMESNLINNRFIVVAENLSYKKVNTLIATAIQAKPPSKKATPFLLEIAWRLDWLKAIFTKNPRLLSKQTARLAFEESSYSSKKIKEALAINFHSIKVAIAKIGNQFLKENKN